VTEAKVFVPFGDDWSVYGGLSGATGVSRASPLVGAEPAVPVTATFDRRSVLVGGDLYVKWKPANVAESYQSLAWQTEAVFRHLGDAACVGPAVFDCSTVPGEWDGGLYSQVVYQFARRWFLGVRGDLLGIPASHAVPKVQRGALSLTFQASEFARLRAYGEVEHLGEASSYAGAQFTLLPDSLASATPRTTAAAFLQLEISIGAHGAHPF
jgi:hypothetical protein